MTEKTRSEMVEILKEVRLEVVRANLIKTAYSYKKKGIICSYMDMKTGELGVKFVETGTDIDNLKECIVIDMLETPTTDNVNVKAMKVDWNIILPQLDAYYNRKLLRDNEVRQEDQEVCLA